MNLIKLGPKVFLLQQNLCRLGYTTSLEVPASVCDLLKVNRQNQGESGSSPSRGDLGKVLLRFFFNLQLAGPPLDTFTYHLCLKINFSLPILNLT